MSGAQRYRDEADRLFALGHYRPAHRMADAALKAWNTDITDEQLQWYVDMMMNLEEADPVLGAGDDTRGV